MTTKDIKADLEKIHVRILEISEIRMRLEEHKESEDKEYIQSLQAIEHEYTNDILTQVIAGIVATELIEELDRNKGFNEAVHKAGFNYGAKEELKRRLQKISKDMIKLQKKGAKVKK